MADVKEKKNKSRKTDLEKKESSQTGANSLNTQSKSEEAPLTHTGATRVATEEDTFALNTQSKEESKASLFMLNGPKNLIGFSWPLTNMVTSVGRSKRLNDISVEYNSFSKVHFQIIKENKEFYVVDLNSTNKTYLNDTELKPYEKTNLQNNSYIRASHLIFKFLDEGNIEAFSARKLLDRSHMDHLTQAGNRLLLKIKGPDYFVSNEQLSLIVFDIDDFKSINDNHGHIAGDYILKKLSRYILDIIREDDMFIRYGGDEFCIFTPNPLSVAENMAERIKQKLKDNLIQFKGREIPLDISIGLSEKDRSDRTWEDIYNRADQDSYEKKRKKKALPA